MEDNLEEFIVIHPYTQEENINNRLRELGCNRFGVIDIEELDKVKSITSNFTHMNALKFNPIYPDITFVPKSIFIQYKPDVQGLGERIKRIDVSREPIQVNTRMSLIITPGTTMYWEDSVSVHDYGNAGSSLVNSPDLLYKEMIIKELVMIGRFIKGSRYTLRFNYDSFVKLCRYLNKSLKYV